MGCFPSIMGRFLTLMGRFPDYAPRGRFTSWKSTGKQPIKKRGIKRFLILKINIPWELCFVTSKQKWGLKPGLGFAGLVFLAFRGLLASHDSNPYPNRSRIARYNATKVGGNFPFFSFFSFAFLHFPPLFLCAGVDNCNFAEKMGNLLRPRLHRPRLKLPDRCWRIHRSQASTCIIKSATSIFGNNINVGELQTHPH